MTTKEVEKEAEKLIRKYRIFDELFPENTGYRKITTKKKQLAGVDYEVYMPEANEPIYIDLKACGFKKGNDYSMNPEDYKGTPPDLTERVPCVPIELRQYGNFTFTRHKLTDYLLFITSDDYGIIITLASYKDVYKIASHNDKTFVKNAGYEPPDYTTYTSFNKTGQYIKVPCSEFAKNGRVWKIESSESMH